VRRTIKKTLGSVWISLALVIILAACVSTNENEAAVKIEFDVKNAGHEIASTMWGIFYEDINFGADGGLYPELLRNGSFEDRTVAYNPIERPTQFWTIPFGASGAGSVTPSKASPLNTANPNYVTINVTAPGYTISNGGYGGGYTGIEIQAGKKYDFYFYARSRNFNGSIVCKIENTEGTTFANTVNTVLDSTSWKKYGPYEITAASGGSAALSLRFEGTGQLDIDFVSLKPVDTWGYGDPKWPNGGLRKDLVEALRDLDPGFIRFPGGCIVEGAYRHDTHYNWKDSIGPLEARKENYNLWGYMMSYGLGFHEFFQLCEDLGTEPVPVLYAGLVCQGGDRRDREYEADLVPGTAQMDQLVQDYLDLIEYANGSTSTVWGAKRAANGNSQPFNIKKIGIGNENWGANYWRNYDYIRRQVLTAYPDIEIITTTGPLDSGWINDEAWIQINAKYTDDIVDEHYYMSPAWFLMNTERYDSYNRSGVRIFVGEYAAHDTGRVNTWFSALCEAAFMTGLERNADIVKMASYAPLFGRQAMFQWRPDMIWFDAEGITNLTANYQIQKLYANNTGKYVLPPKNEPAYDYLFQSTSIDGDKVYCKLVNPYGGDKPVSVTFKNVNVTSAKLLWLTSSARNAVTVSVKEEKANVRNGTINLDIPPYSVVLVLLND